MNNESVNIEEIKRHLSESRLEKFVQRANGDEAAAIELHQESLRIGGALMGVIGTIEIALRNAVVNKLNQRFGIGKWLVEAPEEFTWAENDKKRIIGARKYARYEKYAKLNQRNKRALDSTVNSRQSDPDQRRAVRSRRLEYTEEDVITQITFVFWKRLFARRYEHELWHQALKSIFPGKNPEGSVSRPQVARYLEQIYRSRNRLAHHEPVLSKRFSNAIRSISFIAHNLGAESPGEQTPLAMLLADDLADLRSRESRFRQRIRKLHDTE